MNYTKTLEGRINMIRSDEVTMTSGVTMASGFLCLLRFEGINTYILLMKYPVHSQTSWDVVIQGMWNIYQCFFVNPYVADFWRIFCPEWFFQHGVTSTGNMQIA